MVDEQVDCLRDVAVLLDFLGVDLLVVHLEPLVPNSDVGVVVPTVHAADVVHYPHKLESCLPLSVHLAQQQGVVVLHLAAILFVAVPPLHEA